MTSDMEKNSLMTLFCFRSLNDAVYIFSHFRTEYFNPEDEPCLCVCASVRLSVRLSVCLSRWIFSTIFVRFWWKCTQMILTKIWDDTFFIFSNFCFDDVITVILYVFRCSTLMVVIFKQFSSNWQHDFFYGWVCMGLQTSVLRHHLQGKMTVGKTVKKRSNVKLKTNHRFL